MNNGNQWFTKGQIQSASIIGGGFSALLALLLVKIFSGGQVSNVYFMLWGLFTAFGLFYLIQVSKKILAEKNKPVVLSRYRQAKGKR